MREDSGIKWLSAYDLIKLLNSCPENSRIMVNTVGNLSILDSNNEPIGYIDFLHDGQVVIYD